MPNSRAGSGLLAEASTLRADRVLGGDRIVEHRRIQRVPPPPPLTVPPSHPRHGLPGPTQSNPGTRTDTHDRVRTDRVDEPAP
jgi:hypothetical protein